MQEDEGIFLHQHVCSEEWTDEPKRWDAKRHMLEHDYPYSMKLGFPVHMHFDRLQFTYLALSHKFPYQQAFGTTR
jgi:hypothetical protein